MTENIKKITVRDYKKIDGTITLEPEGIELVVIAGDNGSGKTSFIDAVVELITPKGTRLTPVPIHEGKDSASAEIETDNYIITRTWKRNDAGTLSVRSKDGLKGGKDLIKKLMGNGLIEPFTFLALPPEEQKRQIASFVDVDLEKLDQAENTAVDMRRNIKAEHEALVKRLQATPNPGVEGDERSVQDLITQIREAEAANRRRREIALLLESAKQKVEELRKELERWETKAKEAEHDLAVLPEVFDTTQLEQQLAEVETHNQAIREQKAYNALASEAEKAAKRVDGAEKAVEKARKEKVDAIKSAKIPADGVIYDGKQILVDGKPISQTNPARLEEVALDLATADGDQRLRLAVMKNGDLLDDKSLARIQKKAKEKKFLLLVERDRDRSVATLTVNDGKAV